MVEGCRGALTRSLALASSFFFWQLRGGESNTRVISELAQLAGEPFERQIQSQYGSFSVHPEFGKGVPMRKSIQKGLYNGIVVSRE
jgi:hypothetical protein